MSNLNPLKFVFHLLKTHKLAYNTPFKMEANLSYQISWFSIKTNLRKHFPFPAFPQNIYLTIKTIELVELNNKPLARFFKIIK